MQCRVRNQMVVYCSGKLCLANNDCLISRNRRICLIYKYFTLACDLYTYVTGFRKIGLNAASKVF